MSRSTTLRPRFAFAAGQLLLVAATLGLHGCASETQNASTVSSEPASASRISWFSNDAQEATTYAVDLSGTVESKSGQGESQQLHLRGHWQLSKQSPSATDDGNATILARLLVKELELPTRHIKAVDATDYTARIHRELSRPVLLVQDPDGHVVGIQAPADLVSTALGILKSLASGIQFTQPTSNETTWTAQESDTTGRYEASYSRTETGLSRRKLRYLELTDPSDSVASFSIDETVATFAVGPEHQVTSGQAHEVLSFQGDEAIPALRSETHLSFELLPTSTQPAFDASALSVLPVLPLSAPTPDLGLRYEMDLSRVPGELDLTATLSQMDKLREDATPEGRGARRRLQMVIQAGVRLNHSTERAAWQLLSAGDEHADLLLHALAKSDRAETLLQLMKMIAEPASLTQQQRAQGIFAISTNALAPIEIVRELEQLTNDPQVGEVALLGLGALAHRVQYDPARSELLTELLRGHLERARQARDHGRTKLALRAIGNAGIVTLLPDIDTLLNAPEPDIQALAVNALRRIDDPSVDARLRDVAEHSEDDKVLEAVKRVQADRDVD